MEAVAEEGTEAFMRGEEILACSFEQWYARFRHLTPKSVVIQLPEAFVSFLMEDGIQMPGADAEANAQGRRDADSSDSEWGDGGSSTGSRGPPPDFPELMSHIDEVIANLGGAVLPKLNWSAPKDARWLTNTLRCDSASEVVMLLKASDFIAHDLCHSFDLCGKENERRRRPETFVLALREWHYIDEASEFRCFVRDGRLCAVSQRHTPTFFPHLREAPIQEEIRQRLALCFEEHIRECFPLMRYVFDVTVVGKEARCMKVKVLDFSPWGPSTDPLLFDWEELSELSTEEVELRVVRSDSERKGRLENFHAVPVEVATLGANTPEELEAMGQRAEAAMNRRSGGAGLE